MKNIIFDIGNVLLEFQPEEYLRKYYTQQHIEDLMTIIFASDEWVELDMGTMMIKDVIESLSSKYPEYSNDIIFVLENWTDMMVPLQDNVDIAYQLKDKGYSLYLLSNFHTEAIEAMFNKYDFFHIFDGRVISAHENVVKPDEQIYQILLDRYNLNAEESVFIDDSLANINACQRLGITGIHLPYLASLHKELKTIHVL
ncbi:MAG: HAD family phosphatase [Coprobacillus sp.]